MGNYSFGGSVCSGYTVQREIGGRDFNIPARLPARDGVNRA